MRDGFRPGQGVSDIFVAGLGECDRGYRRDVPHVHRANCGIPDWSKELALSGYRPGEREQPLEIEVRPQERVCDAQLADVLFDGGVIPQEADW